MEISEYQLEAIQKSLDRLRSDISELQYKVQQLDYYKADDKHSHSEYDRR